MSRHLLFGLLTTASLWGALSLLVYPVPAAAQQPQAHRIAGQGDGPAAVVVQGGGNELRQAGGGELTEIATGHESRKYGARFSPDGRWVAYHSDESEEFEIYVTPFPGPGRRWQVSTSSGAYPEWSAEEQQALREEIEARQRELQDAQRRELGGLEERILPLINQIGHYIINSGGKRLRPAICWMMTPMRSSSRRLGVDSM